MNSVQSKASIPSFIIVGAQKSGTTSIYRQLSKHPNVYFPGKELHYFDSSGYDGSVLSYEKLFAGWQGQRAIGEATPSYLYNELVAERIKRHLPNVRLIACLRDPVDRAYSAFQMQRYKAAEGEQRDFVDAIMCDPQYLRVSRYCEQIERYLEYFPRSQLLITWFDMLKSEPSKLYDEICDFIGVERIDFCTTKVAHALPGRSPKSNWRRTLARSLKLAYSGCRSSRLRSIMEQSSFVSFAYLIRGILLERSKTSSVGYAPLSTEDRAAVMPLFEEDIRRLMRLTGKDLSGWLQC